MTHLLRCDGEFVIYTIEYEYKDESPGSKSSWHSVEGTFHEVSGDGKSRDEQRKGLSACGDCWQKTGVHGTFDKDYALKIAADLRDNALTRKRHNEIHAASSFVRPSDELARSEALATNRKMHVRVRRIEIKQRSTYLNMIVDPFQPE